MEDVFGPGYFFFDHSESESEWFTGDTPNPVPDSLWKETTFVRFFAS